jgi:sigma-B regulation protein RsbU (phosphoserine phosphatase)
MEKIVKNNISQGYTKVLEKKFESLKNFVEFSTLISSQHDFSELMTLVMEKAKQVMDAEACSILFYNRETNKLEFEIAISAEETTSEILKKKITLDMGQGIAGWVAENMKPLIIKDVKADKRFFQEADKKTGFITKSLIAVPLIGRRGLIGVAEIINPKNEDYDFEIFEILTKQFAIAIENALFYRESLEREKLKQQLEIASVLQESFLPESPSVKKGNITVSAVNISAAKVGGDIYDFLEPNNNTLGVFIGDVSGKGISAALYMAKIISDFRYIAHTIFSPELVFDRLNTQLMRAPRGMFLTACYVIVDVFSGRARFAVAGHPPFLLVSKKEVKTLHMTSGPPLGIVGQHYMKDHCCFQSGDRVILLTDGVFEAKNRKGKRIGFENIIRFIEKNKDKENLLKRITDHVEKFSKGTERADDLTIVEMRFSS